MSDHILIVDDEKGILSSLSAVLDDEGYTISTAETGSEAFKKIKDDTPSVVLLDVWLPDIDGLEILKGKIEKWYEIIGESPVIRSLKEQIMVVGRSNSRVLVTGENGTGKELVARSIHCASQRADKPFIAVNCAAIPETLIESELFGHEKGAFTGASSVQRGKFE